MTKTVACDRDGVRLDAFLSESLPDLSRSFIAGLIDSGSVTLRGKKLKKSYKTAAGDMFSLDLPEPRELEVSAENIPLDIVFEDRDVIVVNKPKGMVVHPAPGHSGGTLVNALLNHCGDSLSGINGIIRPGIVHRIDKDTSGLIIAAKNDAAHKFLADQLKDHSLSRVYEAVLVGNLREDSGTVDAPIGRHPTDRKKQAVTEKNSREAITHWEVIARYPGFTHARMRLEAGRTHQIRVHMAYIGHPVLGDTVYGSKKPWPGLEGQCLHAKKLRFIHPATKEPVELECGLPDYFIKVLKSL